MLRHRGGVDGRRRLMGDEFEEVRRRLFEPDLDRRRVGRRDAEGVHGLLAAIDRGRVGDGKQHLGVFGARGRVHDPPERIDEIRRRHRLAVRPAPVRIQGEAIGRAVLRHGPCLRRAGHDGAAIVVGEQPVAEVAQDMRLRDRGGLVRIEGFRVGVVAAPVERIPGGRDTRRGGERGGAGEPVPPTQAHQAPVSATSPAASIPATAQISSLSEVSPEMPTAPSNRPSLPRIRTPPGTGTRASGPARWLIAATK